MAKRTSEPGTHPGLLTRLVPRPMRHVSVNVALDDTSLENGCIHYVPGSEHFPIVLDLPGLS